LKVSTVRQDLTSDGSEFQVCGATEKDRRANSVRVFGTISSGASDDRRGRTGTAVWIRSFKYAGVEEDIVLNVSAAILYVTRCLTGSQWSDLRSGLASVRPPRWQTTLAKLFCARCSTTRVAAGAPYRRCESIVTPSDFSFGAT